jgi:8-oxo-dGTP diphosphatase
MGANEQGANLTEGRWLTIPRTLCFVINGDDLLLMRRGAHKRIFPNRYNGVGGHIERDEDPLTSARREILEETGLNIHALTLRAVYNIDAGATTGITMFVFTGESSSRDLVPNDEGTLHWIPRDTVTQLELVEDLPIILPRILTMGLSDPPLFIHLSYDEDDHILLQFADM